MNSNEIRSTARDLTFNALCKAIPDTANAMRVGDAVVAIPQTIVTDEGEMLIWTEVAVTSKLFKPTKVNPAYDPYAKQEMWLAEKREAEEKAAEKKAKKDS